MEHRGLLNRTRVKFCGITRTEDALHAVMLGVDAIGFVFYDKSPRAVDIVQAAEITKQLPAFVTRVGLFVNADPEYIAIAAKQARLDLLQFHGDESVAECERHERPYIKAIRMRDESDLATISNEYQQASGLLLDAYDEKLFGGTGKTFDWSMIPENNTKPIILAGGLCPANVQQAIKNVRPYALDVSGGIEAKKGIKDPEKMNAFMKAVSITTGAKD